MIYKCDTSSLCKRLISKEKLLQGTRLDTVTSRRYGQLNVGLEVEKRKYERQDIDVTHSESLTSSSELILSELFTKSRKILSILFFISLNH